jgi:hypothetical protein
MQSALDKESAVVHPSPGRFASDLSLLGRGDAA